MTFLEKLSWRPSHAEPSGGTPNGQATQKPSFLSAEKLRSVLGSDREVTVGLQELDRFGNNLKLAHNRDTNTRDDTIQRLLDARLMSKLHASDATRLTMQSLIGHIAETSRNQGVDSQAMLEAQMRACHAFDQTFPAVSKSRSH